jgi:manganese-dependent ADP-ribose/CDP-alcohol diphosphatase
MVTSKFKRLVTTAVLSLTLFTTLVGANSVAEAKSDKKATFQFGLVADPQYCDCEPKGTRYYRDSLDKLTEAVETFNQHDLTFTISLGDLIDRNVSSFSDILPIYNQANGPKYHVLGNHDFPVTTNEVVEKLGMSNQYYDFSHKGWRFVVLDTNDLSTYANPKDSEKYQEAQNIYEVLKWSGAVNAQTWNGGVGSEQMAWLRNVLSDAAQNNEKVVVFSHMPIYPENAHNAWNDEALINVLESAGNVVAYFNGHNHAGNFSKKNGIYYMNFHGMVETADSNAYSIVRVFPDRLEIDGYGRESDRILKFKEKDKAKH